MFRKNVPAVIPTAHVSARGWSVSTICYTEVNANTTIIEFHAIRLFFSRYCIIQVVVVDESEATGTTSLGKGRSWLVRSSRNY